MQPASPERSSRDAARVMEDVRRTATARGRAQLGAFSLEGRRLLERALRAGWVPREVLVGAALRRESPDLEPVLARVAAAGGRWRDAPDAGLLALAEGRRSGLIAALLPLPDGPSLDALVEAARAPAVFLVMVDVAEPGNVGALIRTALASGAAGAVCVGATDPFHPKAVRTSLGSLFKLPLARVPSSEGLLEALRGRAVYSLATVARGGTSVDRASWPRGNVALVVGNEGAGLPERLRDAADGRVTIDLSLEADSFCVNAAAAVCLYEVQR
ncbi:MAG TPA: RNA methyltransferase, partial [Polyangiaceae bacterium]|nr:RNA methyltransferase [Polyangiaceae bacterium]